MALANNLVQNLAEQLFGMSIDLAHERRICISCKSAIRDETGDEAETTGEPGQIYSYHGLKEYSISALCETCYDNIMGI